MVKNNNELCLHFNYFFSQSFNISYRHYLQCKFQCLSKLFIIVLILVNLPFYLPQFTLETSNWLMLNHNVIKGCMERTVS